MPSRLHEGLAEIFRHRPSLVAELLTESLQIVLPVHTKARLDSGDLTEGVPVERRADVVVTLTDDDGRPVLAVVIEVQLGRDQHKRLSWPAYLAALRARRSCPVVLLVVCADSSVARWCAQPIELGHPGWVLRPLVLGPNHVPVIADLEQARQSPELAVLSAMAHGADPEQRLVLDAVVQAFDNVDFDHATLYSDVVFGALSSAARRYLEDRMDLSTYEPQSEFVRHWREKQIGRVEGLARSLLLILAARDIEVPDEARSRITDCTIVGQLDIWIRRSATAESVDDLFD